MGHYDSPVVISEIHFYIQEGHVLMGIKHFLIIMTAIFFIVINCNSVFSSEDETVFDPSFYLSIYPDLLNAGYTEDNVENHWTNYGIYEGRQGSSIFDVNFYLQKYSDLQQAFGNDYNTATMHWTNYGIYEGRQGSSTFDANFYLQKYPDLQQTFGNDYNTATMHWINYGIYEGRHGVEASESYIEINGIVSFKKDCDIPSLGSIVYEEIEGKNITKFTLQDKAIGGCSTDNMERHNAPYWERAELKQSDTLSKDLKHIITFSIKITEGFEGSREKFFQIHNYNTSYTEASPSVMLGWDSGKLLLSILNKNMMDHTNFHFNEDISIKDFKDNKWHKIIIVISKIQDEKGTVSLLIDDIKIKTNIITYFPIEGTPHIKYGIYRPGNNVTPNNTSVISFSEISMNSTN